MIAITRGSLAEPYEYAIEQFVGKKTWDEKKNMFALKIAQSCTCMVEDLRVRETYIESFFFLRFTCFVQ